jgi:cardiolipin synthase
MVGVIDWILAPVVIGRDIVIVLGAICFRLLIGPIHFAATTLSKFNMVVQIGFCVLVLGSQLLPSPPQNLISGAAAAVILVAIISGLDYVVTWTRKALSPGKGH